MCERWRRSSSYFAANDGVISFSAIFLALSLSYGIGGKEIISEIRQMNKELPVFVVSGYLDDPVMKDPARYGFTAALSKPFTKVELEALLEIYLNNEF